MDRSSRRTIVTVGLVAGVLLALSGVLVLRQPPPPPPLPSPNGYDELIQASRELKATPANLDVPKLDKAQLQTLLAPNAAALQRAKTGLTRECRVPLPESAQAIAGHLPDLAGLKHLASLFMAESRLADLEERPGTAAEACLNTLRLGQEGARGGAVIDALVGVAIESMGAARLEPLLPRLDTNECRTVVAALETLESRRPQPGTVVAQEKEWTRRCHGLRGQLMHLVNFKEQRKMEQSLLGRLNAQAARNRRLLVAAAARLYELEKGDRPKTLADLVPAYLKAVPQDPVTGTNLHYLP